MRVYLFSLAEVADVSVDVGISYLERFIDPQKSQTLQYFAKELGVRCIDSDYPLYLCKLDEPVTIKMFQLPGSTMLL